jgi:hypothetical protein
MATKWIQKAHPKHGALHKQLGYGQHEHIPPGVLHGIEETPVGNKFRGHKVTHLLKERVNFAINAQKRRK